MLEGLPPPTEAEQEQLLAMLDAYERGMAPADVPDNLKVRAALAPVSCCRAPALCSAC